MPLDTQYEKTTRQADLANPSSVLAREWLSALQATSATPFIFFCSGPDAGIGQLAVDILLDKHVKQLSGVYIIARPRRRSSLFLLQVQIKSCHHATDNGFDWDGFTPLRLNRHFFPGCANDDDWILRKTQFLRYYSVREPN